MSANRVLLIAYHFPPFAGGSGIERTLRFARFLPEFGWHPMVLGAHPRAFAETSQDLLPEIPDTVAVRRAFALDATRHLAVKGRYPRAVALPDPYWAWWLGAVPAGLALIRKHKPRAIWSTAPVPTAHLIGATLQRLTGLPWIADFRDPLTSDGYPRDPWMFHSRRRVERLAVTRATITTYTTPGTAAAYRARYPAVAPARFRVIENGFDEESFSALARYGPGSEPLNPGRVTLVHNGNIYPGDQERHPGHLFAAVRHLVDSGSLVPESLRLRFRDPGNEMAVRDAARAHGIESMVEILPRIAFAEAILEECRADGLLLLQGTDFNGQIPAKAYEYLRAGRPIVALTDSRGDTADMLRKMGVTQTAPLDSPGRIAALLLAFLHASRNGPPGLARLECVAKASRRERTRQLAELLDTLCQVPAEEATGVPAPGGERC